MTTTVTYKEKKTFSKFDEKHYLVFINEVEVPNYVEPTHGEEKPLPPVTGYAYTGNCGDGGTLIEATEATYDAFVSGLIRTRYSADRVESILLNSMSKDKVRSSEFSEDLAALESWRNECKKEAKRLLGLNKEA